MRESFFRHAACDVGDMVGQLPCEIIDYSLGGAAVYADVLNQQRMCLCGMLAADFETLPAAMRTAVVRFFDDNETWLERVLEQGAKEGALHYEGRARDQAQLIISTLEGAMLVARPYGDPERFRAAAHRLLATLDGE